MGVCVLEQLSLIFLPFLHQFSVDFRTVDGSIRSFGYDKLQHDIIPDKSTVAVLPTRIEIRLRKKEPGIKWTSIEAKDDVAEEKAKAAQEAYIEELNGVHPSDFSPFFYNPDSFFSFLLFFYLFVSLWIVISRGRMRRPSLYTDYE